MNQNVFHKSDLILGLGLRFWIKSISDQSITDVEYCVNIIKYLQSYLNDLVPENSNTSEEFNSLSMEVLDIDSVTDTEEKESIVYYLGLRFWENTINSQKIEELNHCKVILKYMNGFFLDFCGKNPYEKVMVAEKNMDTSCKSTPLVPKNESILEVNDMDEDNYGNDNHENINYEVDHAIKIKIKKSPSKYMIKKEDIDSVERKKFILDNKLKVRAEIPKRPFTNMKTGDVKIRTQVYDGSEVIPQSSTIYIVVKCDYCSESFPSVYTASLHIDIAHPERKEEFDHKYKNYICVKEGCKKRYYTIKALHKHYREFHKENIRDLSSYVKVKKDHYCEICDKNFRNRNNYDDHLEEHKTGIGTKLFKCDICGKKFHYRSYLTAHKKKVHFDDALSCLCSHCGETMTSRRERRRHRIRHEKENVKLDSSTIKPSKPKKMTKCLYCEYTSSNISLHMYKEHDHRVVYCDLCGKKCRETDLNRHLKRIHEREKVLCKICGKEFASEDYLLRHMKTMHTSNEEKPFKCTHCEKAFMTKKNLENHMNMHLGLKPYKCQFCGQGFQNQSNRLAHQKKSCKLVH